MNQEAHARAKQLVAQERVEGISQAERDWLTAHLQDCTRCAELTRHGRWAYADIVPASG